MKLPQVWLDAIDERLRSLLRSGDVLPRVTARGTVVDRDVGTNDIRVIIDGGVIAVPVKVAEHVTTNDGDRVVLAKVDGYWVVVGAFTIAGPRGLVEYTGFTTTSAGFGAGETLLATTPSITFRDGRAYEVIFNGWITNGVNGAVSLLQLRKTNLAGSLITAIGQWNNNGANAFERHSRQVLKRTAGSDLTVALALTGLSSTGTSTIAGSATKCWYLEVRDIGEASSYENAITIT